MAIFISPSKSDLDPNGFVQSVG